jgi:antibiotic biosynthesis monooxygenase (ABM) superfamily enzyme
MTKTTTTSTVKVIEPVTVVVSRRVKPGREADYEAWIKGVTDAALTFPGHLGATVFRPSKPGEPYVLVYKFDSGATLDAWTTSETRAAFIERALEMTTETTVEQLSGLETWFTLPGQGGGAIIPPPRWKMAILTATMVFSVGQILGPILHHVLDGHLPVTAINAVSISIMVVLLTWVIMPNMTKLLRPWLYPH